MVEGVGLLHLHVRMHPGDWEAVAGICREMVQYGDGVHRIRVMDEMESISLRSLW